MSFLLSFAWQELRSSGRSLWVFLASLALGVTLIAASSGLYKIIHSSLLADTRALLGGDLEVDSSTPLSTEVLDWINSRGQVSLVIELNTMLGTPGGNYQRVELQTTDANYPLYGQLTLQPSGNLADFTRFENGYWGVVLGPILADRLNLQPGDLVVVGNLEMQVRALVLQQPDRNLNANWRGAPVLLSNQAVQASGLIQPGSRLDYEYHVRTDIPVEEWQRLFYQAYPQPNWEVRTFIDRSERIGRRLNQIASGILMIGLSTLFIGGLGIFNSIQAYLQRKLQTIATLRAIGMRNRQLSRIYLLQVLMLSGAACLTGIAIGLALTLTATQFIAVDLPIQTTFQALLYAGFTALLFGFLTALSFALPAIGKALAVPPGVLFRSGRGDVYHLTPGWQLATLTSAFCLVALLLITVPDIGFGVGFVAVVGFLLLFLEGVIKVIRKSAHALEDHPLLDGHFAMRLALSNQHRPGAPLRSSLLSLGSALTLLVACTLVVSAILRAVNSTIPQESPAMVLYDVFPYQIESIERILDEQAIEGRLDLAPLVQARLQEINGTPLAALVDVDEKERRDSLEQEYKLSYSINNIDSVSLVSGEWDLQYTDEDLPTIVFEDREADQLGIKPGDILTFSIQGQKLDAKVAGIYSQKGVQTRFWFEGIIADDALDGLVTRYVGAAYIGDQEAIQLQNSLGEVAPNIITARTAAIINTARDLLGKASVGLTVVAGISLIASALVLISVIVASRSRQLYTATVLRSLGTRIAVIRKSLQLEYLFLAIITSAIAIVFGSAIALPLLSLRMKLPAGDLLWLGVLMTSLVSILALGVGARLIIRQMKLQPAVLLRSER